MNSIWTNISLPEYPALPGNCRTEIVVIGGGLAGILTAWHLQQRGKQVLLLEANHIGSGQTLKTTAKITMQHNLIYQHLTKTMGERKAGLYAKANQEAIRDYQTLIQSQNITCDFKSLPAYLYSVNDRELLQKEEWALHNLGIPVSLETQLELPFSIQSALCIPDQAQFHPGKFLAALAPSLTIYENTSVKHVSEHQVITDHGTVTADQIVFACHYPFVNIPGFYFARMYQERSYLLALTNAPLLSGMYLGIEKEGLSFRTQDNYLLLGGRSHRTGKIPTENPYQSLADAARHFFPESSIAAHWSAQDCMTLDRVPYIGTFSSVRPYWYVATGFGKWGMTSSMVSARLISDLICGIENPYAEVFSPQRFTPRASISRGLTHMGTVLSKELAGFASSSVRCPHLGCKLSWNPANSTWECPCHGSEFTSSGHLKNGPAKKGW